MVTPAQAPIKFNEAIAHFEDELKKLRVGRPSPEIFNNVMVNAYGSKAKLSSIANINIVDATLVTIQPWDRTIASEIVKALQNEQNSYNPQINGELIRLPIPPMTSEKRLENIKRLKELAEEYKIQIRVIRKEVFSFLDKQKSSSEITEDQFSQQTKNIQQQVDSANKKIEELTTNKEKSLLTV